MFATVALVFQKAETLVGTDLAVDEDVDLAGHVGEFLGHVGELVVKSCHPFVVLLPTLFVEDELARPHFEQLEDPLNLPLILGDSLFRFCPALVRFGPACLPACLLFEDEANCPLDVHTASC